MGAAGLTWGFFGLSLPMKFFLQEAYGITPVAANQKYDAIIQIFYNGGPSQTDTLDPKADPNPTGYQSPNNIFPTLSVGTNDIYGKPFWLTTHFSQMAALVASDPASYGIGAIRSMTHGNGAHAIAESFMNCFWQSPVANLYPSTAASMSYLLAGQGALGIPSVLISGNNGVQPNDAKGSACTTALNVQVSTSANSPTVQMLTLPTGVDAARYERRKSIIDALNQGYDASRPDETAKAWAAATQQAHDITIQGKAAAAFDLSKTTILTGGPKAAAGDLQGLTLAQQLVTNGIPYVAVGIGGNDTHSNNRAGVTQNWGDTTDYAVTQMAANLKATGKRVLVVMGGEFGRTPETVATGRDGRDHHPVGFSWGLFSINQPAFKTTAVGDTGPDGMNSLSSTTPMTDPVYPSALGGLLYNVMGFPVGTDASFNVPTGTGKMNPPVDPTYANAPATTNGSTPWLLQQFGLG
jgi:hypothetical protein